MTIKDPTTHLNEIVDYCQTTKAAFAGRLERFCKDTAARPLNMLGNSDAMFQWTSDNQIATQILSAITTQRASGRLTDEQILTFLQEESAKAMYQHASRFYASSSHTNNLMEQCITRSTARMSEMLTGRGLF